MKIIGNVIGNIVFVCSSRHRSLSTVYILSFSYLSYEITIELQKCSSFSFRCFPKWCIVEMIHNGEQKRNKTLALNGKEWRMFKVTQMFMTKEFLLLCAAASSSPFLIVFIVKIQWMKNVNFQEIWIFVWSITANLKDNYHEIKSNEKGKSNAFWSSL